MSTTVSMVPTSIHQEKKHLLQTPVKTNLFTNFELLYSLVNKSPPKRGKTCIIPFDNKKSKQNLIPLSSAKAFIGLTNYK